MAEYCHSVQEWIEEQIEKPIEEWVKKEEKKCKKKKCKKWCLCCNKWFCWIETFFVKVVTWVVVTVGKWVTRVVCEIIAGALNIAGVLLGLIFAIPILGRLLHELWDILVELFWRIVGLLGLFLDLLGIELRKRLRICIIILTQEKDGKEFPVATPADLKPDIDAAKRIYDQAANVELIVDGIHTIDARAPDANLDVHCGAGAWGDDLWVAGSWFELTANSYCFDGAGQRLIGWAAPVIVFVVRDVEGKKGCSIGPFSDYVTIEGGDPVCVAHEVGHACSLWHVDPPDNLMNGQCGGTKLKKWQRVILRNSRHVTYL
jgi:hypothetical protein